MKGILMEMNNVQRINSRLDEAKNQISDLEHKEAKNNQSEQQEEKRIQKSKDSISSLRDSFKYSNIHIIGVPEGEKKEQEIGNLFEKNYESKLPQFGEENRHASPGSTERPKQDVCKEAHSKTHHN